MELQSGTKIAAHAGFLGTMYSCAGNGCDYLKVI